jgi:L-ribulokinase
VAGGAFEDIATAARELRPATARTYEPNADAKAVYDQVYAVYRDLYETLGRTRAGLLHDLKQIRTNQRRGA